MLTAVAALIIVLGLMVSLASDVRRQSSERLTKELLGKLDKLMKQYQDHHKRLPQVTPFVENATRRRDAEGDAASTKAERVGPREEELPEEQALRAAAELNNHDFVLTLRNESGPTPELFGPLSGPMYDEVTLRDAWGTPIVFMPEMHASIGMALENKYFFFSAGPDRQFRTLEDNLYSYEQTPSEGE